MKIIKLLLFALATTLLISGCGGGGTTNNPVITNYGTVSVNDQTKTFTYTPSSQVAGLYQGDVYCTLTKGASVLNMVQLQGEAAHWILDYSGDGNSYLYNAAAVGKYIGEYQVTLYIKINGEVKLVTNSYLINLAFTKSSNDSGGPPPPPW